MPADRPPQAHLQISSTRGFDSLRVLATTLATFGLLTVLLEHGTWWLIANYNHLPRLRLLGLLATPFLAASVCARLTPRTMARLAEGAADWLRTRGDQVWRLMLLLSLLLPLLAGFLVLDRFANSGDEYAYLFQAQQFVHGHLWARAPPLGDTFVAYRTWVIGHKWLSQYPPGWPMVLALAIFAGIPAWSVNAGLGALGVAALRARSWDFANRTLTLTLVALYVLSPFFVLNSASYFSHTWAALLVLLVTLSCLWYERSGTATALVACGALLGLLGLTRYFSVVLLLPALAWWLLTKSRHHRARIIGIIAACGIPFLAVLLLYQYRVTGSPLRSTYALITNPDVFLSLKPRDVATGIGLTVRRLVDLGLWTSPLLPALYAWCLLSKLRSRSIAFYDLIFPCFVLGYVFFPDMGGNRYGPRYYFDAFPLMLVTILSARAALVSAQSQLLRPWVAGVLLVSAVCTVCALPFACHAFRNQVIQREEPYRLVATQGLGVSHGAIVVLRTPSGRGMPADDLARNDTGLRNPVLYARPGSSVVALHQWAPARDIWFYWGQPGGRLERAPIITP
jgi:hypothetical protein